MSFLLFLPAALLIVALQATVIERLTLAGVHPNLVLISVAVWAMIAGRQAAIPLALLIAILFDAVAGLPLGASVLPLLAVVYLSGMGQRMIYGTQLGWPLILVFIASLLAGLITLIELALMGWHIQWAAELTRILLPASLLNAALAFLLYLPIQTRTRTSRTL